MGIPQQRDAVYACALVQHLVDDLIRAVRETMAKKSNEKAKKHILMAVSTSGTSTSTTSWRAAS